MNIYEESLKFHAKLKGKLESDLAVDNIITKDFDLKVQRIVEEAVKKSCH